MCYVCALWYLVVRDRKKSFSGQPVLRQVACSGSLPPRRPPISPRLRVVRTASGRECVPPASAPADAPVIRPRVPGRRGEEPRVGRGEEPREGGGEEPKTASLSLPSHRASLSLSSHRASLSPSSRQAPTVSRGQPLEGASQRHEGFSHTTTMGTRPTQSTKVRHTPRRSVPRYVSPFVGARYPVQSGQARARRSPISPVYGWVLSLVSEGGLKLRIFYFFTHLAVERCPFTFIYLFLLFQTPAFSDTCF